MSTETVFHSTNRSHLTATTIVAAGLLFMLALLPLSITPVGAQPILSNSLSIQAAIVPDQSNLLALRGDGFSPHGLVFIAISDPSGSGMNQHLWTVASNAVYGPNGSMDPAQGYVAGGTVSQVISFDASSTFVTNGSDDPYWGADIAIPFPPTATYGPNGSQDPAQGYDDGSRPSLVMDIGCTNYLAAQAYDAETETWSRQSLVDVGC